MDLEKLKEENKQLRARILELINQLETTEHEQAKPGEILVRPILSAKDKKGKISLHWKDTVAQFDVDEARSLAHHICVAANSAELDEWVYRFAVDQIGLEIERALIVVRDFRQFRGTTGPALEKESEGGPLSPPPPPTLGGTSGEEPLGT